MDISKLKAFMCVVKWESFTKAAAELFISQPALSKKISDFERELGVPLLVRDNRIIELTQAGRLVVDEAPEFLKIADELEARIRKVGKYSCAQINIGCSGIECDRFRGLVAAFQRQYPEISVSIGRYSAQEIKRMLLTDIIDVALQLHFEVEMEPEVDYMPFRTDEMVVVMSKEHPMAGAATVSMAQLCDETYIVVQPSKNGLRQESLPFPRIVSIMNQRGYKPKSIVTVDSLESLLLQVSCGLGISHLFSKAVSAHEGIINFVPSSDPKLEFQIDLVWNRDMQNPVVKTFTDFIESNQA